MQQCNLLFLPQLAEMNIPRWMVVGRRYSKYDEIMPRVFLAVAGIEERSTIRLFLGKLASEIVGETTDWPTTLAQVPVSRTEMLVLDWNIIPAPSVAAIEELRTACGETLVIALLSQLDARQQAAQSIGADAFISRWDMPESVAQQLKNVAEGIPH